MKTLICLWIVLLTGMAFAQAPSAPGPSVHRLAGKTTNIQTPQAPGANLSWTQPSSGCGVSCTYNIYRGATQGSEVLLTTGVSGLTYLDSAVTRGNSYCWQASAVNAAGEGPKSNEVCAQIPTIPTAPVLSITVQ